MTVLEVLQSTTAYFNKRTIDEVWRRRARRRDDGAQLRIFDYCVLSVV